MERINELIDPDSGPYKIKQPLPAGFGSEGPQNVEFDKRYDSFTSLIGGPYSARSCK